MTAFTHRDSESFLPDDAFQDALSRGETGNSFIMSDGEGSDSGDDGGDPMLNFYNSRTSVAATSPLHNGDVANPGNGEVRRSGSADSGGEEMSNTSAEVRAISDVTGDGNDDRGAGGAASLSRRFCGHNRHGDDDFDVDHTHSGGNGRRESGRQGASGNASGHVISNRSSGKSPRAHLSVSFREDSDEDGGDGDGGDNGNGEGRDPMLDFYGMRATVVGRYSANGDFDTAAHDASADDVLALALGEVECGETGSGDRTEERQDRIISYPNRVKRMVRTLLAGLVRWLWHQLRSYRDWAPLVTLLYAVWKRRSAVAAIREGRFMQQCSVIFLDVDGMRRVPASLEACGEATATTTSRISTPTLFTRTLRALMFDNEQMVDLVSRAAARTTPDSPMLDLGADGWLVMANINAHIMEACGTFGHVAAACGHAVDAVEFIYCIVNDRTTTSRQQLRIYVVRESQLRHLPPLGEMDLQRGSWTRAYYVLRTMVALYRPPPANVQSSQRHRSITSGLPEGRLGRTWLCFPVAGGDALLSRAPSLAALSAL